MQGGHGHSVTWPLGAWGIGSVYSTVSPPYRHTEQYGYKKPASGPASTGPI
ncbi:rCG61039 [Rattus norvegicus]|uniref:RCG61039 n=1 Tax=Rattus norvegicus TaxID=10116 RepID=A6JK01_RAT|nr:rCG61039 [Rattus norvegicus]